MQKSELLRRLPEIIKIQDDYLYSETLNFFDERVPDYFWTAPASTSGKYHPKDETSKHGLWLHTKRVNSAYERLTRSLLEQQRMDEEDLDKGRIAVLLHDSFRLGYDDEDNEHTVADHGEIAAQEVKDSGLPNEIGEMVKSHDGAWGKGKRPETDMEDIVHYSDMVASDRCFSIDVINPHEILYDMDTVNVKEYVGAPRYESAVNEIKDEDLVYAFGCENTDYGWRVFLKSPYEAKDDIKELDNRWWNEKIDMWQILPSEYNHVMNKMKEDGWRTDADSRVEDFVEGF